MEQKIAKQFIVDCNLSLSKRVANGLKEVQERRYHKFPAWRDGLSVLNEETVILPLVQRKALAESLVLSRMPIDISDHEIIVGNALPATTEKKASFPEYATAEEKTHAAKRYTSPASVWGHFSPFYPKYLSIGLGGIQREVGERLAALRDKNSELGTIEWYQAVMIATDGLKNLMTRYVGLAAEMEMVEKNSKRRTELTEIASTCNRLTSEPPETYREALQATWFAHIAFFSTMNHLPLGRLDQNLWPYLKRDLESGKLTLTRAQELTDLFWLKCNHLLQSFEVQDLPAKSGVRDTSPERIYTRAGSLGVYLGGRTSLDLVQPDGGTSQQFLQTVTLGGLTPEGDDGTNPLTYLALNATYRLKLPQPCIYMRLHPGSPSELYQRVAECIRSGCVGPTVYNDSVIIPALKKMDIPEKLARDYTSDGCWEPHIQGRTQFKHGYVSIAEAFDRVINPGRWQNIKVLQYDERFDPFTGKKTKDPATLASYEEIKAEVLDNLNHYVKGFIASRELFEDGRLYDIAPLPLLSAFVSGPIERGRDITQFGMDFSFHMPEMSGLSHVADSLYAIKKLCFEDERVTWPELLKALHTNWEGKEALRQMARSRVPAYGNDINEVDAIATELVSAYVASIRKYGGASKSGINFVAGLATYEHYTTLGKLVSASPDGRFAGDPISSNASPSIGRATSGPTAAVASYLKLPLADLAGGSIIDLSMDAGSGIIGHLDEFIRAYITNGGNILSVAVNDVTKLRAALKEPEKYRDLKVRVGGYEAFFVDLPRHHQELQIKRCEQYVS